MALALIQLNSFKDDHVKSKWERPCSTKIVMIYY